MKISLDQISESPLPEVIILPVDYNRSLEQMIELGRYDWINREIVSAIFPICFRGVVEYEFRYLYPQKAIPIKDVWDLIKEIDTENPWSPARIAHVLTFGAKFPGEQLKYPIQALGTIEEIDNHYRLVSLRGGGSGRSLSLDYLDSGCGVDCRCLVVRKVVGVRTT